MPTALNPEPYIHALQTCCPDLAIQSYAAINDGWDSFVLAVNNNLIFRFPRTSDGEATLRREIALLPVLGPTLPLAIPRFSYIHQADASYPHLFVGYPLIAGEPLPTSFGLEQQSAVAKQLGGFLTALHRFPVERAVEQGVLRRDFAGWQAEYQSFHQRAVQEITMPLLTASERAAVERLWADFFSGLGQQPFTPTLCHNDLDRKHIIFNAQSGRVSGVIDWGDVVVRDPAADFTGLRGGVSDGFARQVLAAYDGLVDPYFWARSRFYADVGAFHEIQYGVLNGDQGHIESGLALLRRVLANAAAA